jgi:hypothetical protein
VPRSTGAPVIMLTDPTPPVLTDDESVIVLEGRIP